MDCTGFDARLLSSPLASSLPKDVLELLSESLPVDNQHYLNTLARLAIDPAFTELIFVCYQPLFADLAARWRGLARPEQIAAAFARVLPVAPYLAGLAEEFIMHQPVAAGDYFLGLLDETQVAAGCVDVLLAYWRLASFRPDAFRGMIKVENVAALLRHPHAAVRYMAVRAVCVVLNVADAAREDMLREYGVRNDSATAVIGPYEGREVDYGFLVLLEGERLKTLAKHAECAKTETHIMPESSQRRIIAPDSLSPLTADLCGILTTRLGGLGGGPPPSTPSKIIPTPTTIANIHSLALHLRKSPPILITGPSGSGKTFLVHQIAHTLNALDTLISIHLGDQTDAKLLVGAYTTADTPGSFEWRPGVLTTAVKEGRWVLVEDIDKAPTEVLSVLLPLMERGELVIPSRGETVVAARGFRLIATMRTTGSSKSDNIHILGSRLWNRVDFALPDEGELHTIITTRFPTLAAISPSLMRVYRTAQDLYRDPGFFALSKTSLGRQISPRDLIKWCTRIAALFTSASVTGAPGEALPDALFDEIFMEAIDCFGGSLQTAAARTLVVRRIADEMQIGSQRVELFLNGHVPRYQVTANQLVVGRAKLKRRKRRGKPAHQKRPFATTNHALRLLEQVGVAVRGCEPVLLVGETGTGKTTVVQQMADLLGVDLTVMNLSQQTESADLLGGYKPVDVRTLAVPLKEAFEGLFERTFSAKRNRRFLEVLQKCWGKQQWNRVITLWGEAVKMAENFFATPPDEKPEGEEAPKKRRKLDSMDRTALQAEWARFAHDLATLERQSSQVSKSFAFSFVEGSLIKAARNGDWVLLDEINLAAPDTLESIADLLKDGRDGDTRSILLSEKGDVERVNAHPDFRIFACMNPATDVGKRDLPSGLRSRFTELYVVSPDQDLSNLLAIVAEYLGQLVAGDERAVLDIAQLYLEAKKLAEGHKLVDGANQRPHFSMRTLTRTLSYVVEIAGVYGLRRSLYEGFCMSFLTLLDRTSEAVLLPVIEKFVLGNLKNVRSLISQIPRRPVDADGSEYVQFKHYWMHRGSQAPEEQPHYIITPFVERNMLNLVRATATRRFPVLIQGPTSSGKTSMIEYLAKRTGHKFVRINNHEHTDLQEYLGSYVSDNTGTLRFQEGILVEALRKGYWIVLDELNLAPTDVLEALNRLLDDNRELMIPETQEVVRPHREFMLFATQNPPGVYGGRKVLSRAFRNRFLELHFDDIPEGELETILRERCGVAPSYCGRIVKVYRELSLLRQSTRLFEQKNSFATLRDLFRWANREAVGYQQLADNGYMLLAERVRKEDEKLAVRKVIESVMKVTIDETALYSPEATPEYQLVMKLESDVVWTKAMRRLYSLVAHSLRNNEPVLLVGETGCGKTTVCQMLAEAFGKTLQIVNAHQNTETGDIIGAQRPIRNRTAYTAELVNDLLLALRTYTAAEGLTNMDLAELLGNYNGLGAGAAELVPGELRARIELNRVRVKALFEWSDGSLIQAMKEGQFFLLDEISLADDSVLERLNSVLEPARGILLAEKGPEESQVTATDGFQFLATMNPGGDYGKKELSPALRNRFTEIWVPPMTDYEDVLQIVRAKLAPFAFHYADAIVRFAQWFSETYHFASSTISIRDVLAWTKFVNMCDPQNPAFGLLHGAALVFIDGLGANPSAILMSTAAEDLVKEKRKCILKLSELSDQDLSVIYDQPLSLAIDDTALRLGDFSLPRATGSVADVSFNLEAPTTGVNAMRVVRAMQLRKPILLEGSPGVGKTSLVSALATASGNPLTRINLSEQTDLMDLFGSDVPVEGGHSGEFAWRDAPFLQAMQRGHWVLLDEMNLASQSVLEGLNACLDHRGEAYIAELDRSFKCHPDFAVFAAQNPHHQGGGRKGLPASFVNRFTVVYVDTLNLKDLQLIATRLYPDIPEDEVSKVITFVVLLDREVSQKRSFGNVGGPWEFNLRDTLRWLGLLSSTEGLVAFRNPSEFVDIVVKQRFRTVEDRARVDELFKKVFGHAPPKRHLYHQLSKVHLQVGHALLARRGSTQPVSTRGIALLKRNLPCLETIMTAVQQRTPVILVGPSGAGKTSIIKLLASVAGAELDEIALNSDIDTTDIVGGFEQVDVSRGISSLFLELQRFLKQSAIEALRQGFVPGTAVLSLFKHVGSVDGSFENLHRLHSALKSIESESGSGLFGGFINKCEILISQAHQASIARFEWVDGMLIHAVEQGKWLVLDNANLCSPSVLDRLNSLLELNGHLIVNEHNDKNGEPKLVRPHPNFRLFLTMDPRHGELSRAMRNRGMEIYMDSGSLNPMALVAEIDDNERSKLAQYSASSTESSMALYSDINRLIDVEAETDVYENLAWIIFDHLPRDQVEFLGRWKCHIVASQLNSAKLGIVMDVVDSLVHLRNHPRVGKLLGDFLGFLSHELNLDGGFGEAQVSDRACLVFGIEYFAIRGEWKTDRFAINKQPIDPMRNTSLLSPGTKKKYELEETVAVLNRIYECTREVWRIKKVEESILQRSATTRMKEMTFLERSASKNQSTPGFGGSIGLPLFGFLSVVRQSLERWLNEDASMQTNMNAVVRVAELLDLWRDMVELSSTHNLNESVFHVYLALLEEWLGQAGETVLTTLTEATENALRSFRLPLQLSTGFSMELLWNEMRPSVPSSLTAWDAYHQLQKIADRFDSVASHFKGSFETIAALKSSLLEALTAVLTSNIEVGELIQGLDKAIAQLESVGSNQLDTRESLVKITFDYLLKFKALHISSVAGETSLGDTLTLAHFAGRTTSSLLGYQVPNSSLRTSYEQVLEDMYEYNGSSSGPQGLIQGGFALEMLRTSQSAKQSFIGQLSQLNVELGVLAKQLTFHTQQVTSDQLLQLNLLLLSNTKKIIQLHHQSYDPVTYVRAMDLFESIRLMLNGKPTSGTLDDLPDLISTTPNAGLKSVVEEHFVHTVNGLVQINSNPSPSEALALAGRAWSHYSLGCLKLYVPNCAFDPAMKPLVQRERYLRRKREFGNKLEAEKTFELRFTGQEDNSQVKLLEERMKGLGEEPPNSLIVRPDESEMGPLQGDLLNLLQVVVHANPHERLLSSILERRSGHKDEEVLFQKNLSQIVERLRRGYPLYKDLVDPILGFIYSLKLGLSIASMDADESKFATSLIDPTRIMSRNLFSDKSADDREDIQLLRLWQVAACLASEGYVNTEQKSKDTVNEIFESFFTIWKAKIAKEQEEAAANASLYRYTGEEENAEETELAAMFPTYEQDPEKAISSSYDHRGLACQIALCHSAIYLATNSESITLSSLIRRGVLALVKSVGRSDTFSVCSGNTEAFLPAIVLSLKETLGWIEGSTSHTYDFYTQENMEQARKLVMIVEKTHARLAYLVETWPEHVTLQDAMETCQQLLDMPNTTPIAQFLVNVEKLHQHLNEWQGVASTEYSAAEHYDAVTQLIISWRRLELTTWPRLFDIEDEKCRTEADSWWFFVYESVIENPLQLLHEGQSLKEHVEQLLSTLVSFIESSSVAQFAHRLQVLRAFEQHTLRLCDDYPEMNLMQRGLYNLIAYYSQYESVSREATAKHRKKFQKSMSDVVLLASWKDTNILALRDSAKRSHKKLFRVVKGYRQAINQPMSLLIQGGMPGALAEHPAVGVAGSGTLVSSIDLGLIKDIYEKRLRKWSERPGRLQDLPAAVIMMGRVAQIPSDRAETANFIEEFSSSVVSTIKQLQSETPGTLNEETKEIAKHLKTRKRKAFADALKELKNMGLKSNLSVALLSKQATLERILAIADPISNGRFGVDQNSISENHYFLRVVEILPKIRKAVVEHSPDLTGPEVARSVGFLEHLLSMALDQRTSISAMLNNLERAQASMARYNIISNLNMENITLYGRNELRGYADLERRFQWLPKVLDLAIELLKIHSDFGGKEFGDAEISFNNSRTAAIRFNNLFSAQKQLLIHDSIWENSAKVLMSEAQAALGVLNESMESIRNHNPEIAYTTTQVLSWVSPCSLPLPPQRNDVSKSATLESLDSALQTLCDSIFVALQQLKEAQSAYPSSAQDPGWLLRHQSASSSSLKALHVGEITSRMDDTIALTSRLQQFDASTSQAVRALFAAYQPIVQEYTNICNRVVQDTLLQHRSICKTTYILCTSASTLLSKGFCMPQEKGDPEGGQSNGVEGGTGLGEGEGQDDISKDIKADEDLSELAQEKDKEERKDEIEDEKDAVGIEDEMEGQLGDMPDKEDDENGSGDEKDDEMDEETGDVDDLDPTAVDEKLWDGKGDDDAREKEGDGMKNQETPGEDMEAKKEENGKEKEGENMQGKEGEEEGDESEGEGADQDDEVRQQDGKETTEAHVPEVDTLDLPDDMELDGDEKSGGEEEDGDMNMDDLSDAGDDGEEVKEDEKGDKQDSFPDLDAPENEANAGEPEGQDEEDGEEGEGNGEGQMDEEGGPEENEEQGVEEQPENLLKTRNEDDSKEADETVPSDIQGVEGGNDEQDANEQTSAQRESGEEAKSGETHGKGTDNTQAQEETTGQASAQEADSAQDQQNKREEQTEQDSSFRKVGDVLEKWHQQRRQILNAKEDEERPALENMELDDPEFEHLPNDDATVDTQALGAATEDQAHSLDDSMAIDSGANEPLEAFEDMEPENDIKETGKEDDENESRPENQQLAREEQETQAGAMIGESREQRAQRQRKYEEDMDLDNEFNEIPTTAPIELDGDSSLVKLGATRPREEARQLWQHYEQSTKDLSMGLCEQLRLILEPTLATKMRGDFRTGKRLNMKRIIPYIASQYKKDKIWMRRTKPSKRQYQVMIAVDDSKSMAESDSVALAFETVALVAKALSQLEVGQISIVSFGETTRLIHPFDQPFTSEAGVKVFECFSFDQLRTNVKTLVETSMGIFESVKVNSSADLWQLEIIISDGVCEDHETLRRLVRKAQEEKIMIVFVILDSVRESSILNMNQVRFEMAADGTQELKMDRYLDSFPFGFYLVVNDIRELPGILALALRQWLAEIVDATA